MNNPDSQKFHILPGAENRLVGRGEVTLERNSGTSLQPGMDNVLLGDPDGRLSREWKEACENGRVGWPERTTGHDNTIFSPKPPSLIRRILSFLRSIF